MTEIGWYNQTTKDNRHCPSLRGRRLKGKGNGVLGKGVLGALIPFPSRPNSLPLPFQTPATQASIALFVDPI